MRTHTHREVSLGYIAEGSTTIFAEKLKYNLRPSDIILIPPGKAHLCKPAKPEEFKFSMVYFDSDWWHETFNMIPEEMNLLAVPDQDEWSRVLGLVAAEPDRGEGPIAQYIRDKIVPQITCNTEVENPILSEIHSLICSEPERNFSIDELAAKSHLGKFSFIRQYALRYGLTPHADLINMKIQRSILMLGSVKSLTSIALDCGFSDQSHFIRQFKLYCGMTPSEYRSGISAILSNSDKVK